MLLFYLSLIETEEDKSKFELIYEKYRRLMFYIADQILQDDSLAEDAVQDAFVKIIENINKIENINSHKTKSFIVIIVRNHAINLYNQRKRHLTVPLEDYEYILFNDLISESESEYALEESDILGKIILQLPVIYKDIITLKFVQELSNTEIAHILNITEPTVRKRFERAKQRIHDLLEKGTHSDAK